MSEHEVTDDAWLRMAQAIHELYLQDEGFYGPDPLPPEKAAHRAMRPWAKLDPDLREQNHRQARDDLHRLDRMGYRVVPAVVADGQHLMEVDERLVEEEARLEHDRWCEHKRELGFVSPAEAAKVLGISLDDAVALGPDGDVQVHADLVTWEELSDEARDKDRRPVRHMPTVLAAAGLVAVPR